MGAPFDWAARHPEPYDWAQDARSESRYETDPHAEPEQWELDQQRYERDHAQAADVDAGGWHRG